MEWTLRATAGTHLDEMEILGSYTRDLPYGYDSLLENLIDVSHVPFAHHGLQGTRDDAIPISMTIPDTKESTEFLGVLGGLKREAKFSLRSPFFFFYLGEFLGDTDSKEEYEHLC
ncbi:Pheophorbide a oxygenase, chloroplastic [Symbiodinium microadriaticum]|uniref:Pheophorbide a oxygenase, chloroplastic n=1 Tax=Symbiodinium microadriaticum TaxID=2951 RepID=A0A1Q9CWH8_SYMMI|nr:Pheophorbide a oxygenase, chloroplastic [Symbiodinium microadriaticum]